MEAQRVFRFDKIRLFVGSVVMLDLFEIRCDVLDLQAFRPWIKERFFGALR